MLPVCTSCIPIVSGKYCCCGWCEKAAGLLVVGQASEWTRQCQLVGTTAKGKLDRTWREVPDDSWVPLLQAQVRSTETAEPNRLGSPGPRSCVCSTSMADLLPSRFYHGSRSSQAQPCKQYQWQRRAAKHLLGALLPGALPGGTAVTTGSKKWHLPKGTR